VIKLRNKKLISKFVAIGVVMFALMAFNWDRTEMEDRAFVVTIGIDKGEDAPFEVTMSILDAEAMEGGEEAPRVLRHATGDCPASAMGQIGATISRSVYFGHTKAIIIGKGVLNDADKMQKTVDALSRNNDINMRTVVMATDKRAAEIMEAKPEAHQMLGIYLAGFYSKANTNAAALVVKADLEQLAADFRNSGTTIIPKVTLEGEGDDAEIKIGGVALLKNQSLAGFIDEEQMAGYLWIKENAQGLQLTADSATIKIERSKPKIRFIEENGRLICNIKVDVTARLEAGRNSEEAARNFELKIKSEMQETFRVFQKKYTADGFGLQEILRKHHPNLYKKYAKNWDRTFAQMRFTTDIELKIRH